MKDQVLEGLKVAKVAWKWSMSKPPSAPARKVSPPEFARAWEQLFPPPGSGSLPSHLALRAIRERARHMIRSGTAGVDTAIKSALVDFVSEVKAA